MTIELIHGDCLKILPLIPDKSVDAVITDLPYGTKKTGWDHSVDPIVFSEFLRISRGYVVSFYSNTRLWHILGEYHKLGVDTWVMPWYKSNAMGFERRFAPQWVPIVVAYSGKMKFWGKDLISVPITPHKDVKHPTPKPVAVMEWIIERATSAGDIVIDPFMGSGTTGMACINTGRNFIGIEKGATYFAEAKDRIGGRINEQL